MSAIGVTPFKRHALHAWVPDSRHVSLSRCDGVYLLTYLQCVQRPAVPPARLVDLSYMKIFKYTVVTRDAGGVGGSAHAELAGGRAPCG